MYISKKDLLQLTGISYGQLYRWKRERLIPEEWFMKQSSYTGQETYFPRDQILERIRFIMDMKDRYSLEEIADMLTANPEKKEVDFDELIKLEEINHDIASIVKKEAYSYYDVVILIILSKIYHQYIFNLNDMKEIIDGISDCFSNMSVGNQRLTFYKLEDKYYSVFSGQLDKIKMDCRFQFVESFDIDKMVSTIKIKYNHLKFTS